MTEEPGAHVYMLRCDDGSYCVGSARLGLERRLSEHSKGTYAGYTSRQLPIELVWSRAKKEALIVGDYGAIQSLVKRRT